ncbi:MAG: hypothetical protein RLZZ299_1077 [Pseudomonadota bacterium]
MLSWLVAAALAAPPAAPATVPGEVAVDLAEEAGLRFALGVAAYRRGAWEEALSHLLVSNRLAPNRNVVYNLARTYEQLGRPSDAWRHYDAYVAQEPDAARRAPAEEALARLGPEVALLAVTSDPPGATIYVDREDLGARGTTPRVLALPPGEHRVTLRIAGHDEAREVPATLAPGRRTELRLPLARVLGRVRLDGEPSGAEVRVEGDDGAPVGVLPAALDLPPGRHVLRVSAPGRQPARVEVEVTARGEVSRRVELAPARGSLVVACTEDGATVEVDGATVGFTPTVVDVPVGMRTVRIVRPGFRTLEAEVEVREGAGTRVDAVLDPLQRVTAASRAAEDVADAPASVTVISGEEMRLLGFTTVADALNGVRGVSVRDDLSYTLLGVRGMTRASDVNQRLLVTLDGHALNEGQLGYGPVARDLLVDLRDVERVEVVRGPGSALYGSNAFAGVVNVVLREGDARPHPGVAVAADGTRAVRARVGTSGTWGPDGGWWATASGWSTQGGDYTFTRGDGSTYTSSLLDRGASGGVNARAWKGDLAFNAYWNGRTRGIATGAYGTIMGHPDSHEQDTRGFVEGRWEPRLGNAGRMMARAWIDHSTFEGGYPYEDASIGVVDDHWDGWWTGAEVRFVVPTGPRLRWTAGGQVEHHLQAHLTGQNAGGRYLDVDQPASGQAVYGVLDADLPAGISLSVGARADRSTAYDPNLNPRVALQWAPTPAQRWKLLAGRAFRAPSSYERLYNDGGVTQVPATAVGAESVRTAELEYSVRPDGVQTWTAAAHVGVTDDPIELVTRPDGLFEYQNEDAQSWVSGLEMEYRRALRRGWTLSVAQTFLQARAGGVFDGERQMDVPVSTSSVRAVLPTGGTTHVGTRLLVEAGRLDRDGGTTRPTVLLDLTATGLIPALGVDWSLGVRNALDWQSGYAVRNEIEALTVPRPGRSLYAELARSF